MLCLRFITCLCFTAAFALATNHAALASPTEDLHQLLRDHWAHQVQEQIFYRTDPDAWRMNGKLSEHTAAARERRHSANGVFLSRLAAIDPTKLQGEDRVSYKVFKYERESERDSYAIPNHRFPITSLFGYHSYYAEAPAAMSFLTATDYDRYLISLADFPRYNAEHIANMQEAVDTGYTHYCGSIENYGKTITTHIVDNVENSTLYHPFGNFPASVTAAEREKYTRAGSQLIAEVIVPEYKRLARFFSDVYLPACRKNPGVTSVQGGDAFYAFQIRYFTTTDMTPREIHNLGLTEVARIREEMQGIIEAVGFDGEFLDFLEYLRTEPRFYPKSVSELLGRAALISKTAEGALPKFFSLLPRGTYSVQANPNRGTFYMPSSGDGTTSGTYFVSTKDLKSQSFYTLEALSLHEGVPGHHLQSALAKELGLPDFRRSLYHAAYGEGWGLYSERLGKEMGFYQDPYSDFGRLTYEAWRAVRLVIDTGMHAFGWSREKAVNFMLANAGLSVVEANDEVDRYITWPAQALSYKIGELKIRELRAKAEEALGADFDIRRFHDEVVGHGSLPIAVLEELINEWIVSEKS